MNPAAAAQLREGASLGRLERSIGALTSGCKPQSAGQRHSTTVLPRNTPYPMRRGGETLTIVIGGGHGEPANLCWVIAESDMILVSVNDLPMMEEQLQAAVVVYGITPAQQRLADLIIAGHDVVSAAYHLGVRVSTARTYLQRMFDKTGVRSRPALARALLSVGSPRI